MAARLSTEGGRRVITFLLSVGRGPRGFGGSGRGLGRTVSESIQSAVGEVVVEGGCYRGSG